MSRRSTSSSSFCKYFEEIARGEGEVEGEAENEEEDVEEEEGEVGKGGEEVGVGNGTGGEAGECVARNSRMSMESGLSVIKLELQLESVLSCSEFREERESGDMGLRKFASVGSECGRDRRMSKMSTTSSFRPCASDSGALNTRPACASEPSSLASVVAGVAGALRRCVGERSL